MSRPITASIKGRRKQRGVNQPSWSTHRLANDPNVLNVQIVHVSSSWPPSSYYTSDHVVATEQGIPRTHSDRAPTIMRVVVVVRWDWTLRRDFRYEINFRNAFHFFFFFSFSNESRTRREKWGGKMSKMRFLFFFLSRGILYLTLTIIIDYIFL